MKQLLFASAPVLQLLAATCAAWGGVCRATPEEAEPAHFARAQVVAGVQQAGAAPLELSFGGLYVYSAAKHATPPGQRLVLGSGQLSQFTLLSAEEEGAMWALREQQLRAATTGSAGASVRRRAAFGHRSGAAVAQSGPQVRVVEATDKTCVPQLAYADSPNWREHLVCWLKATRSVELKHD